MNFRIYRVPDTLSKREAAMLVIRNLKVGEAVKLPASVRSFITTATKAERIPIRYRTLKNGKLEVIRLATKHWKFEPEPAPAGTIQAAAEYREEPKAPAAKRERTS